jgi:hypothetical protein
MTLGFLMEYLEDLNQKMAEENRHIILFLDNTPPPCIQGLTDWNFPS